MGGVPAIEEVRFSITHNRGCFGGCSFCALAFHQGRMVTARTEDSVVREAAALTRLPDFKGYINDVGGPTANFRHPSCKRQLEHGMCAHRACLFPEPCPNLDADHSDYLRLLRRLRGLDGVKKVFIRSGIRYDYLLEDRDSPFLAELVRYHVSGQLRVAPEHCVDRVLACMGKPRIGVYEQFLDKYRRLNERCGKEQFAVPYLMSSHPGCTLSDAVALACYLNRQHRQPEQVQDFYPTPGTISTCMFYTELDPYTMEKVYVPKTPKEKAMQRALLQWFRPQNREIVLEALKTAGRRDLIGSSPKCLVEDNSPRNGAKGSGGAWQGKSRGSSRGSQPQSRSGSSKGSRGKSGSKPKQKRKG
jgi:uncharacterized radical SAM protein YgiQ